MMEDVSRLTLWTTFTLDLQVHPRPATAFVPGWDACTSSEFLVLYIAAVCGPLPAQCPASQGKTT